MLNRITVPQDVADPARLALERMLAAKPPAAPASGGRTPHDRLRPAVHAVVVGGGIAGLTVALHAVEHGCRVTLVTKDVLEHANTRYAQGGIAGVMFADDRAEDHIRDTLTARRRAQRSRGGPGACR